MVGSPSDKYYKNIINMNKIDHFTVTIEDIGACEKIFRPNIYTKT